MVVGDWAVGKTAVVQQFLNAGTAFPKNYSMTLGGEVSSKLVHIPDTSDAVELLILDCSGRKVIFLNCTLDGFDSSCREYFKMMTLFLGHRHR